MNHFEASQCSLPKVSKDSNQLELPEDCFQNPHIFSNPSDQLIDKFMNERI